MSGEFLDSVKEYYYFFEDKYYELLDKVNEKVPVYDIVDPIDRYFPSFILFGTLFLIALFAILLLAFGGPGGPLEPISNAINDIFAQITGPVLKLLGLDSAVAKFVVVDSKGKLVKEVFVSFSKDAKSLSKQTDSFGEFQTDFFGKNVLVEINDKRYKKFSERMDISPGKLYKIELQGTIEIKSKIISFELRDDSGPLAGNTPVTITFSCSNSGVAPPSVTGLGPSHKGQVQSNCTMLTATVNAAGYEQERRVVDVAAQEGTVVIKLSKKKLYATVRVIVKDKSDQTPVANVKLNLKAGEIIQADAGFTDSSGSKIIEKVPAGTYLIEALPPQSSGYPIGYSNEFTIGAAMFDEPAGSSVVILLEKPSNAKKASVKFTDAQTNSAITGVVASLIINRKLSGAQQTSGQDGIVQFPNLTPDKNYGIMVSHKDYVLKVVNSVTLFSSNESKVQEIKLEKATNSNSGRAKVIVKDFGNTPVVNAQVALFNRDFSFPVANERTSNLGVSDFNNLPAGQYYAQGSVDSEGLGLSATSDTRRLAAGSFVQFDLTLILATGEIEVTVVDVQGRGIADANVSFIDSVTGRKVADGVSASNGKLTGESSVKFKVDKIPYIVVEKPGFYRTVTNSIRLLPREKKQVQVTLRAIDQSIEGFGIIMAGVQTLSGTRVTSLDDNKTYNFVFNLLANKRVENVQALIRAGLQSQANADAGFVVIKAIQSSFTDVTYSSCFEAGDNYKPCNPQTASVNAKQAMVNAGTLNPGSYEIIATSAIAEIADEAERDTFIEMRYGAKGKVDGAELNRPSANELYLWRQKLGQSICQRDCGVEILLRLRDDESVFEMTEGRSNRLLESENYMLEYEIRNISGKTFNNAVLTIKNVVAANPIQPEVNSADLGTFGSGEIKRGSFAITAKVPSNAADLNLSLNLNENGDTFIAKFEIVSLKDIYIILSPETLSPQVPSNLAIRINESRAQPIPDADIAIFVKGNTSPLNLGNPKTDSSGNALVLLEAFSEGAVLVVRAEKSTYKTAEKEIQVKNTPVFTGQGLDCVKVNDSQNPVLLISGRQKNAPFSVRSSGCSDVEIQFWKDPESDIELFSADGGIASMQFSGNKTGFIALADNTEKNFQVRSVKQLGVHPLYVKARYKGKTQLYDASLARVRIIDPSARQVLENKEFLAGDEAGMFVLDFLDGKEGFEIANNAYTGLEDKAVAASSVKSYPWSDIFTKFAGKIHITPIGITRTEDIRTQEFEATNFGATPGSIDDPFFLITIEDYYEGVE